LNEAMYRVNSQSADHSIITDKIKILEAMILQKMAGLRANGDDQEELIASMTSIDRTNTKRYLHILCNDKIINYDEIIKSYTFWSSQDNPSKLEEIIKKKLPNTYLDITASRTFSEKNFGTIPIPIPWGHQDDWQTVEYFTTAESLTGENIKRLAEFYHLDKKSCIQENARGIVLWLVARNEVEISKYRQIAQKIMDDSFADVETIPFVIILPSEPFPQLLNYFLRRITLEEFTDFEREEAGVEIYRRELTKNQQLINESVKNFRSGENYRGKTRSFSDYIVPKVHRARIQQIGDKSLQNLLFDLYNLAYRFSPPDFFTQYKSSQTALKTAVKNVSNGLLIENADIISNLLNSSAVAKDLWEKFLLRKWQITTSDYRGKKPGNIRIKEAWKHLEKLISGEVKEIRVPELIIRLCNPPYGYDCNSINILLCTWFGINQRDLQFSANGRVINYKDLISWENLGPKEFINALCQERVFVSCIDRGKMENEISELIRKANLENITQYEANDLTESLGKFSHNEQISSETKNAIDTTLASLRFRISSFKDYKEKIQAIEESINEEKNLKELYKISQAIVKLPDSPSIINTLPSRNKLRSDLNQRLKMVIENKCISYEKLTDLKNYGLNKNCLNEIKIDLNPFNLPTLTQRIDLALTQLDENYKNLKIQSEERGIQSEINMMDVNANLITLYGYFKRLNKITNCSIQTQQMKENKIRDIRNEIKKLEDFVNEVNTNIAAIKSNKDVKDLRDSILTRIERYKDSLAYKKISAVKTTVDNMSKLFVDIEAIQRKNINSRLDIQTIKDDTTAISVSYKAELLLLNENPVNLLEQSIAVQVSQKEKDSITWLERLEEQYSEEAELSLLQGQVSNPPDFLPENCKERLVLLNRNVQVKVDQDVITKIESQFRSIMDPNLRQECLTHLQKIINEK
jgi:hypothetical protein